MKEFPYTMGLDIGIASVGWAVLANNAKGEPFKIERLGVRVFDRAEDPQTGASLAEPRRQARSARRVVRRRRHRKERIRLLLEQEGLMSRKEQMELFKNSGFDEPVYALRAAALDRPLTEKEAVRLLIHYAQRRGYKSNSKSEEAKDKENGKVKTAIAENHARMDAGQYRTVGEMLWKDPEFHGFDEYGTEILHVRNSPDDYKLTVTREMLRDEIITVFQCQRQLHASWATEELEEKYLKIWGGQRNFDEGPGGNSPYGGAQIEKMLGTCTFEKDEPRAPKSSYTAEYFRLLQTVNNIRLVQYGEDPVFLTQEQREAVIRLAIKSPSPTYAAIRKELRLPDAYLFNSIRYDGKSRDDAEKKTKLKEMQFYHELRKTLDKYEKNYISNLSPEQMNEIARVLTLYKSDDNRRLQLIPLHLPDDVVELLLNLSPSKAGHLSVKAMGKLVPFLEQGLTYDKACVQVYGSHDGRNGAVVRSTRLHMDDVEEINNPVVRRAVSQSIKVINAIVREYGPPEVVRIELARELGKTFEERNAVEKRQKDNAARNEKIYETIQEYKSGGKPTGQDIVKFKLFEDQDGVCLYSGQLLDISRLFEPGYVDVDHIVPYSISFDDSYSNKVLVRSSENRQKGNRLPYEYFGQDAARWARFEALVETKIRSSRKRKNLLSRKISDEQKEGFKERNLVDTQYLSRVVFRLIDLHLQFAETGNYGKRRTQTVNGAITAEIRKRLGIQKIREDGDLHHARDAAVIACVSPGMIQKITKYSQHRECLRMTADGYLDPETGELLSKDEYDTRYSPYFPEPWERFRDELEARLSENPRLAIDNLHLNTYESEEDLPAVFVSRMPRHKVGGAGHKETIRSGKKPGYTVAKTPLTELKLDKSGEIAGYYNAGSDLLLYQALKARLTAFDGDAKKAFAEPFYKPKADGTPGPLVKKVKIEETASLTVNTGRGLADNSRMVRVDVFHIDGDGYYYVPVYVADTLKKELPNRAAVQKKSYENWKIMNESDFVFSLYPNDLIRIVKHPPFKLNLDKKAVGKSSAAKEILVMDGLFYFEGYGIAAASMKISTHDRRYTQPSLGGKSLDLIEKWEVDILGNVSRVHRQESRQGFRDHAG